MSTPIINGATLIDPAYRAIARADHVWCQKACDEPLDDQRLTHLAASAQKLVDDASAGADPAEVEQAQQRVEQLLDQVARLITAAIGEEIDLDYPVDSFMDQAVESISAARAQVATLRADFAALAGERTAIAAANLRLTQELDRLCTQHEHLAGDLAAAHRDNADLADDLASARKSLQGHVEAVTAALHERDRLLERLAVAERHRCAWEFDPDTGIYHDCDCGRPWPRYELDEGEPIEPELEPFEALMARVRTELADWGR